MDSPTTKQPYAVRQRDWHDGLFDCTNDCNSCKLFFYCLFFPFFFKKNLVLQLKCELLFIEIFYSFQLTHKRRTLPCY